MEYGTYVSSSGEGKGDSKFEQSDTGERYHGRESPLNDTPNPRLRNRNTRDVMGHGPFDFHELCTQTIKVPMTLT